MSIRPLPIVLLTLLALASTGPASAGPARWQWPVAGPVEVLRGFEPPTGPYGPGHRGVDLSVEPGGTVRTSSGGTVVVAGQVAGRPVVVVAHGQARTIDELRTTYEPVDPDVVVGQRIEGGALLGRLAAAGSHCASGCLHWGLRRGETYLDPTGLLDRDVRLLPAGPPQPVGVSRASDAEPVVAAARPAGVREPARPGPTAATGATPDARPLLAVGAALAAGAGVVRLARRRRGSGP